MTVAAAARVLVLVLRICEKLCEPAPSYGSVARLLGITGTEPRIARPNYAGTPEDDAVAHAIVVGRAQDAVAEEVELWPASGAVPVPAVLEATLGAPLPTPRALAGPVPPRAYLVERRGRAALVLIDDGKLVIRRAPV